MHGREAVIPPEILLESARVLKASMEGFEGEQGDLVSKDVG